MWITIGSIIGPIIVCYEKIRNKDTYKYYGIFLLVMLWILLFFVNICMSLYFYIMIKLIFSKYSSSQVRLIQVLQIIYLIIGILSFKVNLL